MKGLLVQDGYRIQIEVVANFPMNFGPSRLNILSIIEVKIVVVIKYEKYYSNWI